jgi:hypothetical protein
VKAGWVSLLQESVTNRWRKKDAVKTHKIHRMTYRWGECLTGFLFSNFVIFQNEKSPDQSARGMRDYDGFLRGN